MYEVKRCPYCGNAGRVAKRDEMYFVICNSIGECAVKPKTSEYPTADGAVIAWNKRWCDFRLSAWHSVVGDLPKSDIGFYQIVIATIDDGELVDSFVTEAQWSTDSGFVVPESSYNVDGEVTGAVVILPLYDPELWDKNVKGQCITHWAEFLEPPGVLR